MPLRRSFRDSWEQREYKRPARSLSPPKGPPRWEPIQRKTPESLTESSKVSSTDTTKTAILRQHLNEEKHHTRDNLDTRTEQRSQSSALSPDLHSDSSTLQQPSDIAAPSRSFCSSPLSTTKSNLAQSTSCLELEFLHSSAFPIQCLRPVPDLVQLMTQIVPVIGDPGSVPSGAIKFGPRSPVKNVFIDPYASNADDEEYAYMETILRDRPIGSVRRDWLEWEKKPSPKPEPKPTKSRRTVFAPTPTPPSSSSKPWQGRKYSTHPLLKTRHLEFDVLQCKISHGELLSLDLSMDARRDAITIGGGVGDVGSSPLVGKGKGAGPNGLATDSSSNTNGSNNRRNGDKESIPQSSVPTSDGPPGRENAFARTGRYGVGGMMLWRLVRVAGRMDGEGGAQHDQYQYSWWCVPDRALGGWF